MTLRSPLGRHATVTALVIAAVALTGCDGGGGGGARDAVTKDTALREAVDVAALHENRTPHLGDNSRVAALVGAVHPEAVGDWTLALDTDQPPYAVVLRFSSTASGVTADVADDLLTERAALLLATIDNADEVRWELPGGQGSEGLLTRAGADALVGAPVAEQGATSARLDDLVDALS